MVLLAVLCSIQIIMVLIFMYLYKTKFLSVLSPVRQPGSNVFPLVISRSRYEQMKIKNREQWSEIQNLKLENNRLHDEIVRMLYETK